MQPNTSGVKIAQPGYNAATAAAYQLLFDSSWPCLTIVFDETITATGSTQTFYHNLGFFPFVLPTSNETGSAFVGTSFNIYNNCVTFAATAGTSVHFRIYNIDISTPQSYTYSTPAQTRTPYDANYGIKIVKGKNNINSTDLRNFILHSRAASPMILSITTALATTSSTATASYTYPLNYIPFVYGFVSYTDTLGNKYYINAPNFTQSYPGTTMTSTSASVMVIPLGVFNSAGNASLVCLRDPLFAPNTVRVIY